MNRWVCTTCGYIYDPQRGDPEQKIPSGIPFEKLPDNWTCPQCGVPKNKFKKLSDDL